MGFPVKSKMMRFIVTVSCLIAVITTSISIGCGSTGTKRIALPATLSELTLVQMWDELVKATGVQEQTIRLEYFRLQSDNKGVLESGSFQFKGMNAQEKIKYYSVSVGASANGQGVMIWGYWDTDAAHYSADSSYNPRRHLEELDKIGLDIIDPGYYGFSIMLSIEPGGWSVSHEYFDIYHLKDGALTPLKNIGFGRNLPAGRIMIWNGFQPSDIWFITEDINRASTVEYLEP